MKKEVREKLKEEIEQIREKLEENDREMSIETEEVCREYEVAERTEEEESKAIDRVELRYSIKKTKLEADIEFRKDWLDYERKPNRDDYGKPHVWKIPTGLTQQDYEKEALKGYKQDLLERLLSDSRKELLKETKIIDKRKRTTETQRLSRALKYLKEDKWKLFVKSLLIIDSSLLASQSREKIQYVKVLIGKTKSREEIVKALKEWKPKKTVGSRQKKTTTPEWTLMTEEERVKATIKMHKALSSSYHSVLFFFVFLFGAFLWLMLEKLFNKPNKLSSFDPNAIGQVHNLK